MRDRLRREIRTGPDAARLTCRCGRGFATRAGFDRHNCGVGGDATHDDDDVDDADAGARVAMTDGGGGLPDSFSDFASREACVVCGDSMAPKYLDDAGVCVGCRYTPPDNEPPAEADGEGEESADVRADGGHPPTTSHVETEEDGVTSHVVCRDCRFEEVTESFAAAHSLADSHQQDKPTHDLAYARVEP